MKIKYALFALTGLMAASKGFAGLTEGQKRELSFLLKTHSDISEIRNFIVNFETDVNTRDYLLNEFDLGKNPVDAVINYYEVETHSPLIFLSKTMPDAEEKQAEEAEEKPPIGDIGQAVDESKNDPRQNEEEKDSTEKKRNQNAKKRARKKEKIKQSNEFNKIHEDFIDKQKKWLKTQNI